jgi:hypothetical protein
MQILPSIDFRSYLFLLMFAQVTKGFRSGPPLSARKIDNEE